MQSTAGTESGQKVNRAVQSIDEIFLAPAKRGRPSAGSGITSWVRELGEADVEALANQPQLPTAPVDLQRVTHAHHSLARLIATGKPAVEVALLTGYTPEYIHRLKRDPAFIELLGYYETQKEQVFADVLERMKVLGLMTLEQLQQRIDEQPDSWSHRELMELAKLTLVEGRSKPGGAASGTDGGASGAGVVVNVKFVGAESPSGAPMVNITPRTADEET